MHRFGLLGYPLGHSFSKRWFEDRGYRYDNFEYASVADFLRDKPSDLEGFNVTIPHKQSIMAFLDDVDSAAADIGAVNCVTVAADGSMKGYNTDYIGFEQSLLSMIGAERPLAAVLGSGGASKAVCYVLRRLGIDYQVISRADDGYSKFKIQNSKLIINTTPLGMYPNVDNAPKIDYEAIDSSYFLYDLVYNPVQTEFLRRGRLRGARVINGLPMLYCQAQAALQHFLVR